MALGDLYSDILQLNKQRLLAMEELDRLKNERSSLLDELEQLKLEKHANRRRGFSTCVCTFRH